MSMLCWKCEEYFLDYANGRDKSDGLACPQCQIVDPNISIDELGSAQDQILRKKMTDAGITEDFGCRIFNLFQDLKRCMKFNWRRIKWNIIHLYNDDSPF